MIRILLAGLVLAMTSSANAQNRDQALITAAGKGELPAVERLLREGASVSARDSRGRTPLLAATHGNHVAVARALITAGADVNAKDDIQDSPFLYAGAEGRIEILRVTLPTADLKSTNRYGGTALIPACHHGHVETVRELLKTAIDVNHVNRLGWTALLEVMILGDGSPAYIEITHLLLAHGANVNLPDNQGVTPLGHARQRGQREIASILEAAGAL